MSEAKIIKMLRKKIPIFECKPGCHDCCGPVPFSKWEWGQVEERKAGDPKTLTCPYAGPDGCEIYEDRPIICRLFGTVPDPRMKCPHGCRPKRLLSAKETEKIMRKYLEVMREA